MQLTEILSFKILSFVKNRENVSQFCFVICAENYHKLIQGQFLIRPPSAI